MADHTILHINCRPDQKKQWLLAARIAGCTFEDWVCSTLDAATPDTAPTWATGLSERARVCLLGAGLSSREDVKQAWEKRPREWWVALPNFGSKCYTELEQWLK